MKTQFRDAHGILNSLQNLIKYPNLFIALLEAAESFDLYMIRRSSLLSPEQKQILLQLASQPLPLRHQARLFLRRNLGNKLPARVQELPLPIILHKYLLYEISWADGYQVYTGHLALRYLKCTAYFFSHLYIFYKET